MKIIDIINKIANGTLEDGFKFKYDSDIYRYNKEKNEIRSIEYDDSLVEYYKIEMILNKEVEVIEENKRIEELLSWTVYLELKKGHYNIENILNGIREDLKEHRDKINELVRAVNKINKEREEE